MHTAQHTVSARFMRRMFHTRGVVPHVAS
jgi:hypothetical protein